MFEMIHDFRRTRLALVTLLAATSVPYANVIAQGLDAPNAVEKIIGSPVREDETATADDEKEILAAIEKTVETTNNVRMATNLDSIKIVFLSDATVQAGGPPPKIEAKLKQFSNEVRSLKQELEGNAMLYHAIDSRGVLLRDVIAVEFQGKNKAVIFAAGKPSK
jgi:hypothetical protein